MINVEVTASVLYTCILSEKDSKAVKERAKELAARYCEDEKEYYKQAAEELYHEGIIELYRDSLESDFSTECIERAYDDGDDEDDNEENDDD